MDTCTFVTSNCEVQSNFNFLTLYYCHLDAAFGKLGKIFVFIPLGILFLYIGMYMLASTADMYLSPALETITLKFKLSDSLAGVTLLAFGNGAPDVFSSIAAAGGASEDTVLDATKPVSILLGGGFFVTCVVVTFCTKSSPGQKISITPQLFLRDICFYLLACVYLLGVMTKIGYFNMYLSFGLLALYAIYVLTVVFSD